MDRWTELELFAKIAESGSLAKASAALSLSTSAASRHLASLEARLNARLVERTTRRLHLTEAGCDYLQRCKSILAALGDADAAVSATALQPTGTLSFCLGHITPLLPGYLKLYPGMRVHLEAANRYVDLLDSSIDLAIRTREFEPDSDITVRRLAATRRVLAAWPPRRVAASPRRRST